MVLALLLAHQDIRVLALESHKDFSCEYRGEVLIPRFTLKWVFVLNLLF